MGDPDEVGRSVRELKLFCIRVWKHHPHDPEASVMLHEIEGNNAMISNGVVTVTKDGTPTHWIRTWDYVEITETQATPKETDR